MSSVERYYVREHSGYTMMRPGGATPGNATPGIEVMVIDRDYCHRVVKSYPSRQGHAVRFRREAAHILCAELNEAS